MISHSGRSWSKNLNVIEISQFLIDARHYTLVCYLLSMRLRFRFNRPFVVLCGCVNLLFEKRRGHHFSGESHQRKDTKALRRKESVTLAA